MGGGAAIGPGQPDSRPEWLRPEAVAARSASMAAAAASMRTPYSRRGASGQARRAAGPPPRLPVATTAASLVSKATAPIRWVTSPILGSKAGLAIAGAAVVAGMLAPAVAPGSTAAVVGGAGAAAANFVAGGYRALWRNPTERLTHTAYPLATLALGLKGRLGSRHLQERTATHEAMRREIAELIRAGAVDTLEGRRELAKKSLAAKKFAEGYLTPWGIAKSYFYKTYPSDWAGVGQRVANVHPAFGGQLAALSELASRAADLNRDRDSGLYAKGIKPLLGVLGKAAPLLEIAIGSLFLLYPAADVGPVRQAIDQTVGGLLVAGGLAHGATVTFGMRNRALAAVGPAAAGIFVSYRAANFIYNHLGEAVDALSRWAKSTASFAAAHPAESIGAAVTGAAAYTVLRLRDWAGKRLTPSPVAPPEPAVRAVVQGYAGRSMPPPKPATTDRTRTQRSSRRL